MIKTMPILLGVILFAEPALAAQIQMICKNPRQSYLVTFDDEANIFRLRSTGPDTFYQVDDVEKNEDGQIVRGKTVKDGPDFVAWLGGKKRIEFMDGAQVIQTDLCE